MKVVHILNELKFSGAEVMLKVANAKFQESQIDTYILSTGEEIGEYSIELESSSYKINKISFSKSFNFSLKVYRFLRENKFNIVHIHCERFFFFYIIIAKLAGVETIFRTIHNTFKFKGWLKYRRKLMLKIGKLIGCSYISISKSVFSHELKMNGLNTILINNWIDTEYFKPLPNDCDELNKNKIQLNLVSVGACSDVKRHFYILELVSALMKKGYKVNYFHIGSGELEVSERKAASHLNISEVAHFMGNQNNVLPFLHKSDFFIMPSEYEGLGNSCLEAMSAGLIPIVTKVPGLIDLVTDELNGFVVDFENIEFVVTKIIQLHKNETMKRLIRNNAREKVIESYGLNNVEILIKLYLKKHSKV